MVGHNIDGQGSAQGTLAPTNNTQMSAPTKLNILPLHTHTAYSLMDGVSKVEEYIKYCKESGMEACSCTDHGYVLGLYDLITKCKEADLKSIAGIEAYLLPHSDYEVAPGRRKFNYFHLTLWAMNQKGYKNLLSLSNASWGPGRVVNVFGNLKPRISWEDLEEYNEGIICGSGCIEGPIVKPWLRGEPLMSQYGFNRLYSIFGEQGRLFMEVMPHTVDRDWETKGVVQVEGENGFTYTFMDTDEVETEQGFMTAKEACEKRVVEVFSSTNQRPQDFPLSNRIIDSPLDIGTGDVEEPEQQTGRVLTYEG